MEKVTAPTMEPRLTIPAERFDPADLPLGRRTDLELRLDTSRGGAAVALPAVVLRGARPGQTLAAVAGIHGDEFEGMLSLGRVCRQLDPALLAGTLVALPIANRAAWSAGTRVSPADRQDMARVFPGRPDGTATERLAHFLTDRVFPRADLLVDLHSAGALYAMPRLAGWPLTADALGARSRQAALAFGASVLWASPLLPGRSLTAAHARGVPCLYVECTGTGGTRTDDLDWMGRGLVNLLKHLKVLPGEPETPADPLVIEDPAGFADLDTAVRARAAGLWRPEVDVLATVVVGDLVGTISDPWGARVDEARAPRPGRVLYLRHFSRVRAGEALFQVA